MSLPDRFSYHFYPVGQGLFTTGSIYRIEEDRARFLWVYDCGTSSSPRLVDNAIASLKDWAAARPRIDMLTLSHFDHDHISGVCRLIQEFRIGTLMLPYMPLAQRLVVAFEEGTRPNDPTAGFYVNPVAHLLAQGGPGIERILFVLPSGGDGPPFPEGGPGPQEPLSDDDPDLHFERGKPEQREEVDPLFQAADDAGSNTVVEFLRPGSAITIRSCLWEFVPYNDDPEEEITEKFVKKVEAEKSKLLNVPNRRSRAAALRRLKRTYDRHFGAGSEERNLISLFLYSGPIYPSWDACELLKPGPWYRMGPRSHYRFYREVIPLGADTRCSVLYSGDGYLDSAERLRKFTDYLRLERIQRTGAFQVMHHGAENNWHKGVAAAIKPNFSVFSSDPERKKWRHPHAPVLRDFWPYGAVQVDKELSFTLPGLLG